MAITLNAINPNQYEVSKDLRSALDQNSYLIFFDSSPLLPSKLLKNYIAKINHHFQTIGRDD